MLSNSTSADGLFIKPKRTGEVNSDIFIQNKTAPCKNLKTQQKKKLKDVLQINIVKRGRGGASE